MKSHRCFKQHINVVKKVVIPMHMVINANQQIKSMNKKCRVNNESINNKKSILINDMLKIKNLGLTEILKMCHNEVKEMKH